MLNHLFSLLTLITWVTIIATTDIVKQPEVAPSPPTKTYQTIDPDIVAFHANEIHCLALNAYFETRNSVWDDMVATSHVVVNRVKQVGYPETICEVVNQPYQFSWTHDGKRDVPNLSHLTEAAAWRKSILAAIGTYFDIVKDPTGGATHYHAYYVEPYWTDPNRIKIGKHYYMKVA